MTAHPASSESQFKVLFNIMQRIYTLDVLLLIIKQNTIARTKLIDFLKYTFNIPSSSAYRYLDTLVDKKMILFMQTTQKSGVYSVPKNIQTFLLKLLNILHRKNVHTTPTKIITTFKGLYIEYSIISRRQLRINHPKILLEPESYD